MAATSTRSEVGPRPHGGRRWLWWGAFLVLCAAWAVGRSLYERYWVETAAAREAAYWEGRRARTYVAAELSYRLTTAKREDARGAEDMLKLPTGYFGDVPALGEAAFDVPGELVAPPRAYERRPAATGWTVHVTFVDGRLSTGHATPPPMPPWPTSSARTWLNRLSLIVLFTAPLVWLGGLLAGFIERMRGGTRFGEVALAAAIAASVAWVTIPGVFRTPAGWCGLAVGGVMGLPALAMIRRRRRIARALGRHRCHHCDYDLTGNISGACPECGTPTHDGIVRQRAAQSAALALAVVQARDDEPDGAERDPDPDADEDLPNLVDATPTDEASRSQDGSGAGAAATV